MSREPVIFSTVMFETANEAFLFCKDYLRDRGFHAESRRLRGLDPISAPLQGHYAIRALQEIRPLVPIEAKTLIDFALSSLARALENHPLPAVA